MRKVCKICCAAAGISRYRLINVPPTPTTSNGPQTKIDTEEEEEEEEEEKGKGILDAEILSHHKIAGEAPRGVK